MKFGLRAKINAGILSLVFVVLGLIVGFMSVNLKKQAKEANFKLYDNIGKEISSKVASAFNLDLGLTRALASSYEGFADLGSKNLEEMYRRYLRQEMLNNDKYLAFWISMELKELDPDYPKEHGRITWLYDRLDGELKYRQEYKDTDPNNLSPQYQAIKKSRQESLIDPYWYIPGYEGALKDSLLETTVAVPVMRNNKVVGLAGIDFTLTHFLSLNKFQIDSDTTQGILFSNNGTILAHEDSRLIGKTLQEANLFDADSKEIAGSIEAGKAFQKIIQINNHDYYLSFAPIQVGESSTPWSVCVTVPLESILAKTNRIFLRSVLFGFIGMLILAMAIFIISTRIIRPVEITTKRLSKLSTGEIDGGESMEVRSHDEIGAMAMAFNALNERLDAVIQFARAIGSGRLDVQYPFKSKDDMLGSALSRMQDNLVQLDQANRNQDWIKTGLNGLNDKIRGDLELDELVKVMITYIAKYLTCQGAALYIVDEPNQALKLVSGYAFTKRKELNARIAFGEGLVGQCLIEKEMIQLTDLPDDYFPIKSATGSTKPKNVIVYPCIYDNRVLAVIELATLNEFDENGMDFLKAATQSVAIGLNSAFAKEEMKKLLAKTLEQKEELQAQEEELREANLGLEKQAEILRQSEANLQAQQEELRVTNQELEKNAQMLEEQSERIKEKNKELEETRKEIEKKAAELAQASKYKSEFLANMSHELRTPLNSMLILSQSLAENTDQNLNPAEVESAEIIYKSGRDLLNLINEVLDLSKIEAGKMNINTEAVRLKSIAENMERLFKSSAEEKGLTIITEIDSDLPDEIMSDQLRIEQIIKNLLSNAMKFTSQGSVTLIMSRLGGNIKPRNQELAASACVMLQVRDTGIGISREKQELIFEAFQQEDGSTSRKYGGTGLGLSISKELTILLKGELQLQSEAGKGSVFTLLLPATQSNTIRPEIPASEQKAPDKPEPVMHQTPPKKAEPIESPNSFVPDDRENIQDADLIMMIVEDDPEFAKILVSQGRKKGFKCITAGSGEHALWLVATFKVAAIVLDIKLPGIDGWQVLDALKKNTLTRHIPVHMISGEEETLEAFQKGAMGYLVKPVTHQQLQGAFERIEHLLDKKVKNLLIVEDDQLMSQTIQKVIRGEDIQVTGVGSGQACLKEISQNDYDCIILDLGLPDMSGFELLKAIEALGIDRIPPIIVYTGQDLTREQNDELKKYAKSIIVKGVKSEERLLDETALFLHRVMNDLSDHQQQILKKLYNGDDIFKDRKILLVDDDMRNIFALSRVFEERGMRVFKAENGKKALGQVRDHGDLDIVLMDIMMPEMDGYEAIKEIRKLEHLKNLPVIALTAKAMKEDKQKCLDAGASDYITKPVDVPKLLSLVRVWLSS